MRSGFVVVVVAGSLVAGSFSARAATAVPLAPGALFSRDVNNDGRDDVVLLDPTDAPAAASVVFGRADRSGPLNRVAQGPGGFAISADGEHLGRVAIVGDVNADGYADIAVGIAERGSQRPGAWLVFGGPDAVPIDLSVPPSGRAVRLPDARSPEFGGAGVVGVGDVNGDGISDLATGQELRGHGGAVVVFGRRTWPTALRFASLGAGGFLIKADRGESPVVPGAVGDANKDGRADIGIVSDDPLGVHADYIESMAWVVYGQHDPRAITLEARSETRARVRSAGRSAGFAFRADVPCGCTFAGVTAAGDVNGDGRADMLVPEVPQQFAAKDLVEVIFGQQRTRQQRGSGAGLRGIRIATGSRLVATSIGDLTGDGRSDVIASDPAKRNVVVYPGRRLGVVTPVASQWTFAGDAVIVEMLPAGDVDGDGRQDLLVRLDGSVTAAIVYGQPTLAAVNLAAPGSSATIIR